MIAFPFRIVAYGQHGSDPAELDAILINSVWALANFITLVAAACVAYEQPQRRAAPRVRRIYPCALVSREGTIACRSGDLSESGIRLVIDGMVEIPQNARISIRSDFGVEALVGATPVWSRRSESGQIESAFTFTEIDSETHPKLVQLMFSGDQSWAEQGYPKDRVWSSFWRLVTTFWRISAPCGRDQKRFRRPLLDRLRLKPGQS
jgi:hypothetical protein